jgi:hypothetical protein
MIVSNRQSVPIELRVVLSFHLFHLLDLCRSAARSKVSLLEKVAPFIPLFKYDATSLLFLISI